MALGRLRQTADALQASLTLAASPETARDRKSLLGAAEIAASADEWRAALALYSEVCKRDAGSELAPEQKKDAKFRRDNAAAWVACEGFAETVDLAKGATGVAADILRKLAEINPSASGVRCSIRTIEDGMIREITAGGRFLQALSGLPIESLQLANLTTDLSPLRSAPLRSLKFTSTGDIVSLDPLRGKALETLHIGNATFDDLEPLRGMPLRNLTFFSCKLKVKNLDPLRGMQLEYLLIDFGRVDMSVLTGMPLKYLQMRTNSDHLPPLAGVPLKTLSIHAPNLRQIDGLAGLPLESLRISNPNLPDLSPLADMPLRELDLSLTGGIRDFTPLYKIPTLRSLKLPQTKADIEGFRDMPLDLIYMEKVGGKPETFWRAYDASKAKD